MACGCAETGKKPVRIARAKLAKRVYTVHLTDVGEVADVQVESLAEARELAGQYGEPRETWAPAPAAAAQARGRLVMDDAEVAEPLLAIAEGDADVVGCCGGCATNEAGTPRVIQFEKATRTSEGFAFEMVGEVELPKRLVKAYEQAPKTRAPVCIPWVKVARDPQRFRQCMQRARSIGPMTTGKRIAELVQGDLVKEDQEVFLVVMLDTQLQVRGVSELARGARDRVSVSIPDVLRLPLLEGATTFVIVHNHPSGRTEPSDADKMLTKAIAEAGKTVGITLLDHVIVGVDSFYSFNDHGLA